MSYAQLSEDRMDDLEILNPHGEYEAAVRNMRELAERDSFMVKELESLRRTIKNAYDHCFDNPPKDHAKVLAELDSLEKRLSSLP